MTKPKDYDEAVKQLDTAKEALATTKVVLREFKTENKIKRNKPIEDEKIKASLEKQEAAVETARATVDEAKEAAKELKPRKERVTKYDYPADCVTDKDKKKYRAKKRREAKKSAAEAAGEGKPEKKKVVKKPAAEKED